MNITENLQGVLGNIVRNRQVVEKNLAQAELATSQLDEVSLASVKQLLKQFEHPQAIGQFVQAVAQVDGLRKATAEMDTAIALLQAASDDEAFLAHAQAQLSANIEAANSPLPAAGQSSEPAPAAQVATAAPASA